MMTRLLLTSSLALMLLLTGCTAQQWQGTKALIAVVALGTLLEAPLVTTQCRTVAHGSTIKTVCTSY